jgi:hypothetical protein
MVTDSPQAGKPQRTKKVQSVVNKILTKLDSLNIDASLTERSYELIAESGFRNDNGVLAAIICQELVESNPVTLRGLFYRVVSTGFLPSTKKTYYKRVGRLVTSMRRCGLIRYEWIVDSLRSTVKPSSWSGLQDFADTVRTAYRKDFWTRQGNYVHIFCEKDAIAGVLEPVTQEYDVALSPVRGYCSESFAYQIAAQWKQIDKPIYAGYLGDYDPSGFDIERDLRSKLTNLSGKDFEWVRLGVNQEDFEAYNLVRLEPKKSDKRFAKFAVEHGEYCAEVDAIPASSLRDKVREFIDGFIDHEEWQRLQEIEAIERESFCSVLASMEAGSDE